jgi:hypothetical protein
LFSPSRALQEVGGVSFQLELLYPSRQGFPLGEEDRSMDDLDLELDVTSYTEIWLLVAQLGRNLLLTLIEVRRQRAQVGAGIALVPRSRLCSDRGQELVQSLDCALERGAIKCNHDGSSKALKKRNGMNGDVVSLLVSLQTQLNQYHSETKAFILDTNKCLEQLKGEQKRLTEEVYTLRKDLRLGQPTSSPRVVGSGDDLLASAGSPTVTKHHTSVKVISLLLS